MGRWGIEPLRKTRRKAAGKFFALLRMTRRNSGERIYLSPEFSLSTKLPSCHHKLRFAMIGKNAVFALAAMPLSQ